jgi:hypothetical protein
MYHIAPLDLKFIEISYYCHPTQNSTKVIRPTWSSQMVNVWFIYLLQNSSLYLARLEQITHLLPCIITYYFSLDFCTILFQAEGLKLQIWKKWNGTMISTRASLMCTWNWTVATTVQRHRLHLYFYTKLTHEEEYKGSLAAYWQSVRYSLGVAK